MATGEPQTPRRGRWRQVYLERRFSILLVILVVLIAGPPVLVGFGLYAEWFDWLTSLLLLAAILSLCLEYRQRLLVLLLGVPCILFSLAGHALSGKVSAGMYFVGHICQVLFLWGSAVLIVRSFLFSARALTFDSIFGAVCGYLFLGLGWAVLYSLVEGLQPGSFEFSRSLATAGEPSPPSMDILTYYSFVTLTTVGYGDVNPISPVTRTFSWIEAVTGQFYLTVVVAGLVSMLVTNTKRALPTTNPTEQELTD
jgi:voltage-gated potassium channel